MRQRVLSGSNSILMRDDPPKLWVVLSEGVLRQAVGGVRVMREQLDHLLAAGPKRRESCCKSCRSPSLTRPAWTALRPCSSSMTQLRLHILEGWGT